MEWCKSENGEYTIVSINKQNFPGSISVIKKAFCQDEAVSIGTEINKNPIAAEELLELCADAALDGVSLAAIHDDSGEVVAVAFNKLQVAASDPTQKTFFEVFSEERCTQKSSFSLIQFMADVDARCNMFEKYNAECSLEIMFLVTLKEHRKQGLGELLCKVSLELGQKLQTGPVSKMTVQDLGSKYVNMPERAIPKIPPKICNAIWTSPISQKIGKSLGFEVNIEVSYEEFTHEGKTYAERIGPGTFCQVAAKVI